MPEADLALLIETAEAAGDIALSYSGATAQTWEKPGNAGPVTEADLAVNELMADRLRSARRDYGWLSEESEDTSARLNHDRVFIIDPIDGTRSFADGSRTWAHSLAIVERGVTVAAVVYLPQRELMYTAATDAGAHLNGKPVTVSPQHVLEQAEFLAARPTMEPRHWAGTTPGFRRAYRPSLAYRMALVAQGRFDGMLTFRPSWEWDIAAGDLILREAGATCTDRGGKPLRFNNAHPKVDGVIASGPALHAQVLGALSHP